MFYSSNRVRPLSCPKTDVFLLCFSITDRTSYENVTQKWMPELKHHSPIVPIILVGTKQDMQDKDATTITQAEGQALAAEIEAEMYLECSSASKTGISHLFEYSVTTVNMNQIQE